MEKRSITTAMATRLATAMSIKMMPPCSIQSSMGSEGEEELQFVGNQVVCKLSSKFNLVSMLREEKV